jgi:hypothetical protein
MDSNASKCHARMIDAITRLFEYRFFEFLSDHQKENNNLLPCVARQIFQTSYDGMMLSSEFLYSCVDLTT